MKGDEKYYGRIIRKTKNMSNWKEGKVGMDKKKKKVQMGVSRREDSDLWE